MTISSASVTATCDRCLVGSDPIELTALAQSGSWDERNVKSALKRMGWQLDEDGTVTCDECLIKKDSP